jgi:cation transport ATPase
MQAATVGVAFGQNSDITAEAADAVVLEASLGKLGRTADGKPDFGRNGGRVE